MPRAGTDFEIAMILASAHALLLDRGWTRGVPHDPVTGHYDILGAMAIASGCPSSTLFGVEFPLLEAPETRRAYACAAWDALDAELGQDPAEWNDAPERTVREVLALLRDVGDRYYFRALAAAEGNGWHPADP